MLVFYGYDGKVIKDKKAFPYAAAFYKEGYKGYYEFRSFYDGLEWENKKQFCFTERDGMYVFIPAVGIYVPVDSIIDSCQYVTKIYENMVKEEK